MKTGKVPVNVLKRSILKELKHKRDEVIRGAEVGADNALLRLKPHEEIVVATESYEAHSDFFAYVALVKTVNNLACAGAEPVSVTTAITLPEKFSEPELKQYMRSLNRAAEVVNVEIVGGDTRISAGVKVPLLTITGIGKLDETNKPVQRQVQPGQELVVSKWIGMEGALLLVNEKEKELQERYPFALLEAVKAMEQHIMVSGEAATAIKSGVSAMHDLSEGGILGGLWEFAEQHRIGLEIDLKKIPVKQEIIEICEFYELNPYALRSGGCMLMAADNGANLVRELQKNGIFASVIGRVTAGNDRVILNEEEKRFLDLPQADEIYKINFGLEER